MHQPTPTALPCPAISSSISSSIYVLIVLQCCLFATLVVAQEATSSVAGASKTSTATLTDLGTRKFGQDWPIFLGPTGNSKSNETGILTDWSAGKLPVVWELPLTESYGTCTVSGGRVFQFDRQNDKGVLLCVHSETGKELWRYRFAYTYRDQYGYNAGPRTSPLVDGNRVYLLGVDGLLICVNAVDGSEIWRVDTSQKYGVIQNFFGVGSNPVVVDDLLVVMVGGSPEARRIDRAKGNGSGIVAFDKYTGQVKYKISNELASYASLVTTKRNGRDWCFAFLRGGLLTFNPLSGKTDSFFPWRARSLESVNASVPVVIDDRVFISETYGPGSAMLKFTTPVPDVVWQDENNSRDKAMQTHWNTAVYHEGYLYGSSGRHETNAELRCIDALDGKVKWTQLGLTRSSLLYVDQHLVCLSEDGALRLLKASPKKLEMVTGVRLVKDGRAMLSPPAWAAPVLSHGLLYVRGKDRLVCLELIPNSNSTPNQGIK